MLECPYQSRVSAFQDGELDADTARQFESHLPGCASCSDTLRGIGAVSALLKRVPEGRMSQMGLARLHQSADRAAAAVAKRRGSVPMIRAMAAVAASILVIAGAWLVEIPASHPAGNHPTVQPVGGESWEEVAQGKQAAVPSDVQRPTGTANAEFSDFMVRMLQNRQAQP